jgi:HEAT repeat protein
MVTYFCSSCWTEVPPHASHCPACSADLDALDQEPFVLKLERALDHPEPSTARRAAWLLGQLGKQRSVPALLGRFRAGADLYLNVTIVESLARIGGRNARIALEEIGRSKARLVRDAARRAMNTL